MCTCTFTISSSATHNDRITDGFQISFELRLLVLMEIGFSNIIINSVQYAELDLLCLPVHQYSGSTSPYSAAGCFSGVSIDVIDLLAQQGVKAHPSITCIRPCPPESTTPACFKTGSISGVMAQHMIAAASMTSSQKRFQIGRLLLCQLYRLIGHPFGNRKNRTFLRLHNCLVCSFYRFLKSIRQEPESSISSYSVISLVKPLNSWDKMTPELPLAPRREPEEIAFARIFIVRHLSQRCHFFCRRHNRHCHVRTGISIRNREHIQFVDPLFLCFQILRSCQETSFASSLGIDRIVSPRQDPP